MTGKQMPTPGTVYGFTEHYEFKTPAIYREQFGSSSYAASHDPAFIYMVVSVPNQNLANRVFVVTSKHVGWSSGLWFDPKSRNALLGTVLTPAKRRKG